MKRARKSLYIEMMARSALEVAKCCERLHIHCRDPPAATTSTLYGLGYNQYQVRSFWEWVKANGSFEVPLYHGRGANFRITIIHTTGPLREYPCNDNFKTPIDELDSRRLYYYEYAPNAHKLYAYVEGSYGGVGLKVNIERLIAILARVDKKLLDSIVNAVIEEAWGRSSRLNELVWVMIDRWRDALSLVLPAVPRDREDMARYLPLMRRRSERG